MKKYLVLITCLISSHAFSQVYSNPFLSMQADTVSAPRNEISLNSSYNLSSNALNNRLFNSVLFGDFISDEDKMPPVKNLEAKNRLGLVLHNSVFYSWQAGNSPTGFFIDISSRIQIASVFTPDVYKLVAMGNKQFAGETAVFGGSKFSQFAYQGIQFGTYRRVAMASGGHLLWGGGISLIMSGAYTHVDIERGNLFTSADGDSLALDAKVKMQTVPASNLITQVNGTGAAINIFGAYQFKNMDMLRFQAADLGFISYFNGTSSVNIDRSVSYNGAAVNADSGQFTFGNLSSVFDTVQNILKAGTDSQSFAVVLPFQVRLVYVKHFYPSFFLTGAIEYIHDNMHVPEVSLSVAKPLFHGKVLVRLGGSALGYGNFGITAGASANLSKNISITVGTQHFEGVLPLPDGRGQGYYASLKWHN